MNSREKSRGARRTIPELVALTKAMSARLKTIAAAATCFLMAACAGQVPAELTSTHLPDAHESLEQVSRTHRDLFFEELFSSRNTLAIEEHLQLKMAQDIAGFSVARQAMSEFDRRIKTNKSARFILATGDTDLLAKLEGADAYRALASEQLVSDILFLTSQLHSTQRDQARAVLAWFNSRGSNFLPLEHLALQAFGEELSSLASDREETAPIIAAFLMTREQLLAIERDHGVQKTIEQAGAQYLLHAEQEMRNWISHFKKARLEAQNEFEYYPTVVGRKHRVSIRTIASAEISRSDQSASPHDSPLRPLTARSLKENTFVLIYTGAIKTNSSLTLIAELKRQNRAATFFVESGDLTSNSNGNSADDSANRSSAKSLAAHSPSSPVATRNSWSEALKKGSNFTFAFAADSESHAPASLQSNSALENSLARGRISMENLQLPLAPFVRPGFDAESGRLGKLAHAQHLRLVRTNITSFDQIDFDSNRVAERVATQILQLKTGLIELHANTPRASEIQIELGNRLNKSFPNSNAAPRFVALTPQTGDV